MKHSLHIWAERIIKENGLAEAHLICQGEYYEKEKVRSLVYEVTKKDGLRCILKVWDDPRPTDEPLALQGFNQSNKSSLITAPELYDYHMESPHKGWMLIEKLPEGSASFQSPLLKDERRTFLDVFVEYHRNFPKEPSRDLMPIEKLDAGTFHLHRIIKWFGLAHGKDLIELFGGREGILDNAFLSLYGEVLQKIYLYFQDKPMVWTHGHFRPGEVWKVADGSKYYLLDFAHSKMYPQGYELAFIVWADFIMNKSSWELDYNDWKSEIQDWLDLIEEHAGILEIEDSHILMKYALAERILGTILADIGATSDAVELKQEKVARLVRYLKELMMEMS